MNFRSIAKTATLLGAGAATAYAAWTAVGSRDRGPVVLHVVPEGDGWRLAPEGGAADAGRIFDTKDAAVTAGRDAAHRRVPSQLVIHRTDGTIQSHHTYES